MCCSPSSCPYLMCSRTPSSEFFRWLDSASTQKVKEKPDFVPGGYSFGGRPPFSSPPALPGPPLPASLPLPTPRTPTPRAFFRDHAKTCEEKHSAPRTFTPGALFRDLENSCEETQVPRKPRSPLPASLQNLFSLPPPTWPSRFTRQNKRV